MTWLTPSLKLQNNTFFIAPKAQLLAKAGPNKTYFGAFSTFSVLYRAFLMQPLSEIAYVNSASRLKAAARFLIFFSANQTQVPIGHSVTDRELGPRSGTFFFAVPDRELGHRSVPAFDWLKTRGTNQNFSFAFNGARQTDSFG
jgi:hypothetical protein